MKVLVTGGAGYIGSHACLELLEAGYDVVVVDNLINSKEESLKRVQKLVGKTLAFHRADLRDRKAMDDIFCSTSIDVVMHFAGLKAVGESEIVPLRYYQNNIIGTLVLCEVMEKYDVKNIVFSSSATVYGEPRKFPITESCPISPVNPYGRTKMMIEEILKDLNRADATWNVALLRYFNPIGAHQSGHIGEDPNGVPNNLIPYIAQVAIGKLPLLSVFGDDYPTPDGTGIRDYIHVTDLASAHVKALEKIKSRPGVVIYNLGTGRGYSVYEMLSAFEKTVGKKIPYKVVGRRPGDIASCYADASKANEELDWWALRGVDEMCVDAWRWQTSNPDGYN